MDYVTQSYLLSKLQHHQIKHMSILYLPRLKCVVKFCVQEPFNTFESVIILFAFASVKCVEKFLLVPLKAFDKYSILNISVFGLMLDEIHFIYVFNVTKVQTLA